MLIQCSRLPLILSIALPLLSVGCGNHGRFTKEIESYDDLTPAQMETQAEQVRRDPVAYLHRVLQETRQLDEYTLEFIRYERRGAFGTLHGPERIRAWFRQDPFSVRLKWLDEDLKYDESVYVADQHEGQVRFVTRWWVLGLKAPPAINIVDLQTPVTWGEAREPLSQFGLQRLMERTMESLRESGNAAVIEYVGLEAMPDTNAPVHHIRLTYSDRQHKVPIQELFVDIRTDLPAGTELRHRDGRLEAAYFYFDIDTDVNLTDEDFLLGVERSEAQVEDDTADNAAADGES